MRAIIRLHCFEIITDYYHNQMLLNNFLNIWDKVFQNRPSETFCWRLPSTNFTLSILEYYASYVWHYSVICFCNLRSLWKKTYFKKGKLLLILLLIRIFSYFLIFKIGWLSRSSPKEVFILKCVLKKITLWHECSSVNLLHIFKTPFPKNTSERLLLIVTCFSLC